MNTDVATLVPSRFEIRFDSLVHQGRGLAFPCDPKGVVDVEALSERARNNYFFAWDTLGSEYGSPRVVARID